MDSAGLTIYTIGHSNVPVEQFTQLLQQFNIRFLVDVRSSPYSRFTTQFNREEFQHLQAMQPFKYFYAGKALGGRPEDNAYYDAEGFVLYNEIAKSPTFQEGLMKLLQLARQAATAVMCSEEDPHECHRRLLIAKTLVDEGVTVRHIRGDGRLQTEEDLLLEATKGQLGLGFDDGTEPGEDGPKEPKLHECPACGFKFQ